MELISNRPKNRQGFSRRLLGDHLHVVLAMVSYTTENDGFDAQSLERIIEELFHEVGRVVRHIGGVKGWGKGGKQWAV